MVTFDEAVEAFWDNKTVTFRGVQLVRRDDIFCFDEEPRRYLSYLDERSEDWVIEE